MCYASRHITYTVYFNFFQSVLGSTIYKELQALLNIFHPMKLSSFSASEMPPNISIDGFTILLGSWQGMASRSHTAFFGIRYDTCVALVLVAACISLHSAWRKRYAPPGPPRLPILGNALQVHRQYQFLQFTDWSRKFGE